jgi:hypothetical protein
MSSFTNTTFAPDTKPRAPSPSDLHVVDINEGHVTEDPIHHVSRAKAPKPTDAMIHVQPLKKSEMQVCAFSLKLSTDFHSFGIF